MDYHQWTYSKCNNLSEMISHYWLLTIKKLSYHWLSWKLSITISAISGSMAIDLFYINRKWTVTADGSRPSLGPRCWNLVMLSNGHCLFSFFFQDAVNHPIWGYHMWNSGDQCSRPPMSHAVQNLLIVENGILQIPSSWMMVMMRILIFFSDSIILYNLHHLAIIYNRNIPTVWWYLAC